MDRPEKSEEWKIIIYSFPCIVSCHLPKMTALYLLFQLGFLLFLLLLWWLWLGLPKLCWIKVATMEILVFFLILECFHLFTIESVRCEFVLYVLSYVEVSSLHSHFLESFFFFFLIINMSWHLSKTFSASVEMMIFILQFVNVLYCFASIEESLPLWY